MASQSNIVILDCGSQYTQLIARRIRELRVHSEILPWDASAEKILSHDPKGIVISGGPRSVLEEDSPTVSERILKSGIPILGICYGMQLLAHRLGGKVMQAPLAEYGPSEVRVLDSGSSLLKGLPENLSVWMSHWDSVVSLPPGFRAIAESGGGLIAGFSDEGSRVTGLQFHPEVAHTPKGMEILRNFLFSICGCFPDWNLSDWAEQSIRAIREQVGADRVVCGLSGGVDSTVAAVMTARAIDEQLECIFVNNGLLRLDEAEEVLEAYREMNLKVHYVDATGRFLEGLSGVAEPERKRKVIGELFVRVFEEKAAEIGGAKWLLQGTLYPDIIESGHKGKGAAVIKTHHNVGGLPERMSLKVLEPLRDLFKDEGREIGKMLGIPDAILKRHPFPGPGLAVRCLGEVTAERLDTLRRADAIFIDEIRKAGLYDSLWQAFCVLLPARSVGVMGDVRTYAEAIALRAVESLDAMTADWARLPAELLNRTANRICNEVQGVNRVVYDVTSKPPATIEWE
jgi:GMP synthase (glutamine-hydrolysing)